jgi:hypothetical protein
MRTPILTGLLAACSLGLVSGASAQSYLPAPIVDAPAALNVGPDEEIVIRETIIRRRAPLAASLVVPPPVPSVPIPTGYIRPGSFIPTDIRLEPYDEGFVRPARRYSYFVSPSNKIVVVDPIERRVVRVLDR